MKKKQFAKALLKCLNKFLEANRKNRIILGKKLNDFFLENQKFDDETQAFDDSDFKDVEIIAELDYYGGFKIDEKDLILCKEALEKIVRL